jgi:hypothetical protein
MSIVLKDKIRVDTNFINDLIAKSWEESESIQNQIDSIEVDSDTAVKVVKLLKELLTGYYVFTGCLENLANEPIDITKAEPAPVMAEAPKAIPKGPAKMVAPNADILPELDYESEAEPFEYFVDFDEPTGEPLTDDDLYS